jgi:hypothetical protein
VKRPLPAMTGFSGRSRILTIKHFFMSQFLEQKELFDGILHLGEEEKRDPMLVFERFFSDYRLHECRHILWTMVETCLTTENTGFSDAEERSNLLLHYRDLQRLLEAGALLLDQHQRQSAEQGKH